MAANFCPCMTAGSVSTALFNLKKARQLNPNEPEQTGKAIVLSRTVEPNNDAYRTHPWIYLVTFRVEDGTEVQLQVSEERYGELKENTAGTLCWQGNNLLSFETE